MEHSEETLLELIFKITKIIERLLAHITIIIPGVSDVQFVTGKWWPYPLQLRNETNYQPTIITITTITTITIIIITTTINRILMYNIIIINNNHAR